MTAKNLTDTSIVRMLRMPRLKVKIDVSSSTIYSWINPTSPQYDPTFPRPINLGANTVGWVEAEIDAWIKNRIVSSRGKTKAITTCEKRSLISNWWAGSQ